LPRVEWWLAPAYVFTILPPLSNRPRSHRHVTMMISRTSVRMIITSCHDHHHIKNTECPCWLQFQFRQLKPTTKRTTANSANSSVYVTATTPTVTTNLYILHSCSIHQQFVPTLLISICTSFSPLVLVSYLQRMHISNRSMCLLSNSQAAGV
jgi:hypothetical protein